MNYEYEFYGKKPNLNLKENEKFIDIDFKPNDVSIFGEIDNITKEIFKKEKFGFNKDEEILWTRIWESDNIIPFARNFKELDIKQGILGDCYFIAFLHGLRWECPSIFNSIFGNCQFDKDILKYIYMLKKMVK